VTAIVLLLFFGARATFKQNVVYFRNKNPANKLLFCAQGLGVMALEKKSRAELP
jgi:hypothetical protein